MNAEIKRREKSAVNKPALQLIRNAVAASLRNARTFRTAKQLQDVCKFPGNRHISGTLVGRLCSGAMTLIRRFTETPYNSFATL
jgi:hypothetical protein